MPNYDEAVVYVENLLEHGKSMADALDHAFHRYGTDRTDLHDLLVYRLTDTFVERGMRSKLES